jgi:hypothetical protein
LPAVLTAQVRVAEFEIHNRGNLWDTMKDDGTLGAPNPTSLFEFFPSMDWPGGPAELTSKDEQRSYSFAAGTWIGGRRADGSVFVIENGPFAFRDQGEYEEMEVVENFVERDGFDPTLPEQTITARWTTSNGITVQRTSSAWSFPSFKDFIVLEYEFSNETGGALTDVYFGFPYLLRPSYQDVIAHNGWGDDLNRTDELVGFERRRAMMYAWDDTPNFDLPTDVGNFVADFDELRTPGYAGVALLGAPEGANGEDQPSNVLTAQLLGQEIRLTLASTSEAALYAILSGEDRTLQSAPDDRLTPFMLMSCGPYTVQPGETITISMVEAVNGIPLSVAREGLDAQAQLPAGLDSLRNTVDRAKNLYDLDLKPARVPPPSPAIEIIPLPTTRSVSIEWLPIDETWTDPISGITEITEYRVFRSDRSFLGPYEQIRRIRPNNNIDRRRFFNSEKGVWQYIDQTVSLGVGYFYAVVSVDSEGDVSGLTNRNEEAIRASAPPAENTLNVTVFPNPFRLVSGFPTAGEESTIVWANLPARATIRVYTSSGELFSIIEHDNPDEGQAVWDQLSDSRQLIVPGVYFWTVESDVGTAQGTLLLIK